MLQDFWSVSNHFGKFWIEVWNFFPVSTKPFQEREMVKWILTETSFWVTIKLIKFVNQVSSLTDLFPKLHFCVPPASIRKL